MVLLEDTRNQINKHDKKHKYFDEHGIEYQRCRLYVGDYTLANNQSVCIDTKFGMAEIYSCLIADHERFRAEADRAAEAGIKLYILIEEPGIQTLNDVRNWKNPRYLRWLKVKQAHDRGRMLNVKIPSKPPVNNITLMKIMSSFSKKHGCEYVFCSPEEAGAKIVELLTNE